MSGQPEAPIHYLEPGSSWWPVLWGPLFSAVGAGLEATTGVVHGLTWVLVGALLTLMTAGWVNARRKVCAVTLTATSLRQGREVLPVGRIAKVTGVEAPAGAKPLGGGFTVPRKTTEVPVELDDGSVVLAWARYPEDLTEALKPLVERKS
ncbi:hypothetical protein [Actinokineospora iranica]|uniref:DUF3093 domain-containing protein n=1 Tax=Actinokineospora iranica TaxID=1271860 RepID=A0A1G6URR5_9PSEU|nr:hypothetical protein [Actinokineospora iranica]SDD43255.1 hypothetical protein SAMN05216174_11133 [Actinokineospora iranica]